MSISTMAIGFQHVKVNGHWWIWMSRGGAEDCSVVSRTGCKEDYLASLMKKSVIFLKVSSLNVTGPC